MVTEYRVFAAVSDPVPPGERRPATDNHRCVPNVPQEVGGSLGTLTGHEERLPDETSGKDRRHLQVVLCSSRVVVLSDGRAGGWVLDLDLGRQGEPSGRREAGAVSQGKG